MIGIVSTSNTAIFILISGILLIFMTSTSFLDIDDGTYQGDQKKVRCYIIVLKVVIMALFSVLSGNIICFSCFMLIDELKPWYRGGISILVYLLSLLVRHEELQAMTVIYLLLLVAMSFLLWGIQTGIEFILRDKEKDKEQLKVANINELHTKQMNEQLIMNNYLVDKNARLVERENISRNIHNSAGHSITAAIMTLDAADMLYEVKPDEARKKMQDANERIRGSLDSIRRAVRVLDHKSQTILVGDLKCELHNIVDSFMMDTTRTVQMNFTDINDDVRISREHAEFITGALEEMLTNGVRHGQADSFVVILIGDGAHIRMIVSDNGNGDFNKENRSQKIEQGFGLKKIVSYVKRCGGKAEFTNDNGFRSVIELPIYEKGDLEENK
jgi:signal transduction histidine kinase